MLVIGLACANCQSNSTDTSISADLNSSNPAVAAQAQKVQELAQELARLALAEARPTAPAAVG